MFAAAAAAAVFVLISYFFLFLLICSYFFLFLLISSYFFGVGRATEFGTRRVEVRAGKVEVPGGLKPPGTF